MQIIQGSSVDFVVFLTGPAHRLGLETMEQNGPETAESALEMVEYVVGQQVVCLILFWEAAPFQA